jgi:predicted SprT family Zn-dependent metalloprotease/ribosomal protein L37E
MTNAEPITVAEYRGFQQAYDFFNAELFGGTLPNLLVTLQRKANSRGYFSPDSFRARADDTTVHELALNPDTFVGRTDEDVLSTLVHEMAHVWQECFGKPPRRAYHDKQWAAKMESLGLMPSSTGEPGGKRTGQRMTHYIIASGPYALAYARLRDRGYQLGWQSAPNGSQTTAKRASKTKFTCTECGQNAWAKPDAVIACGACEVPMAAELQ